MNTGILENEFAGNMHRTCQIKGTIREAEKCWLTTGIDRQRGGQTKPHDVTW